MPHRQTPPLPTRLREQARLLRSGQTREERRSWQYLRSGRFGGYKFRRQHPIPPYVADFCCVAARLVIELDGSQHNQVVDGERDACLRRSGYRLLRFWNNDVNDRLDDVLAVILEAVQAPALTPIPSPTGRGGQHTG